MAYAILREFKLADAVNAWEPGRLYQLVVSWVAERQREKKLSENWTSVQSFNGDQLLTLRTKPIRGLGPYIIIYDDRFEAHTVIHPRLGLAEIIGQCRAADPKFFDVLFNTMIDIQTNDAQRAMGEMYEC